MKEKASMTPLALFVQIHGRPDLHELQLAEAATLGELHEALEKLGVKVDEETFVFIDEADEHEHGPHHQPLPRLKHGCRVHVSRCKRIETTVHYLDKTAMHAFAPGTRVRAVKAWAAQHFHIGPKDAAEHVLQLCKSTERPSSDTPLQQLVHGHDCAVCFDFVPEKRVEG
ncbi:MAG: hypothetical protein AB1490_01020 [Pseudomonadota bacterium]